MDEYKDEKTETLKLRNDTDLKLTRYIICHMYT
jgi:hypothetical protein